MAILDIHGKKVHIEDEHSDSLKHAVHYLEKNSENAHAFFDEAHRNHVSGVAHFNTTKPSGYQGATKFTLIHNGDGTYTLRKKEHHLL